MSAKACYLPVAKRFLLEQAARALNDAFGLHNYLVGSCMHRADYRDVDVRCILPDEEFDKLFGGTQAGDWRYSGRWSVMCAALSDWLSAQTGLPVDFQFQRTTQANEEFKGIRSCLGILFTDGKTD